MQMRIFTYLNALEIITFSNNESPTALLDISVWLSFKEPSVHNQFVQIYWSYSQKQNKNGCVDVHSLGQYTDIHTFG